jgi:hypothetical protein
MYDPTQEHNRPHNTVHSDITVEERQATARIYAYYTPPQHDLTHPSVVPPRHYAVQCSVCA